MSVPLTRCHFHFFFIHLADTSIGKQIRHIKARGSSSEPAISNRNHLLNSDNLNSKYMQNQQIAHVIVESGNTSNDVGFYSALAKLFRDEFALIRANMSVYDPNCLLVCL